MFLGPLLIGSVLKYFEQFGEAIDMMLHFSFIDGLMEITRLLGSVIALIIIGWLIYKVDPWNERRD